MLGRPDTPSQTLECLAMTGSGGPPQVVVPGAGWVDVASRVIVQVGFPVVVAGVLLWFLLTRFQDNMNTISLRMAANTDAAAKLVQSEENMLRELQGHSNELKLQTTYLKDLMEKSTRLIQIQEERQKYYQRKEAAGK